ncbi:sugar isomerase [Streptomyces sp. SPB074]|nr:sugar isomerase [Streptomyces sp. SPB074]
MPPPSRPRTPRTPRTPPPPITAPATHPGPGRAPSRGGLGRPWKGTTVSVPEGTIPYRQARAAQPAALERVARRLAAQLGTPGAFPAAVRPVFAGIGASHAALALPVALLGEAGFAARRVLAGDLPPGPVFDSADLVLGVSQSGRSPETLAALALAGPERAGALVNAVPSPLAAAARWSVDLGDEPDSYASTVGYTGTLVGLTMLARHLEGWDSARALAEWAGTAELLEEFEEVLAPVVAEVTAHGAHVVAADFVGSGASLGTAEAGALLLREVARVPATALATRTYLHGAMESAGRTLHVVLGDGREGELARSLARAGHLTLAVTAAPLAAEGTLHVVRLPGLA